MRKEVKFKLTPEDDKFIQEIAKRVASFARDRGEPLDMLDITMDLTACHCNGNPLKLAELLAADDFNFVHDTTGIMRHIDRSTGELGDCFSPRFAA